MKTFGNIAIAIAWFLMGWETVIQLLYFKPLDAVIVYGIGIASIIAVHRCILADDEEETENV